MFIAPYRLKACHNLFAKDTILWAIMCLIIKSLFHEHTLKYAGDVEDCTVVCNLQGKQKLHFGIQMLINCISSSLQAQTIKLRTKKGVVFEAANSSRSC